MDHLNHKRYYWIVVGVSVVIGILLFFWQEVSAADYTFNCTPPPAEIPVGESFNISCYAFRNACPNEQESTISLYAIFYYEGTLQKDYLVGRCPESYSCQATLKPEAFSRVGQWRVRYCFTQECGIHLSRTFCPFSYDFLVVEPPQTSSTPPTLTLPTGYDNPLKWNTILEFLSYILRMLFWVGVIILFFVLLIGAYYVITSGGSST
ncbi:hypothetical protein J7J74_02310, partial [bacterium]|nr:hypothetical protein [bacterium]